jgi:hypothetical protein
MVAFFGLPCEAGSPSRCMSPTSPRSNSNRQKQRIYLVGAICGSIVGVLITLFSYFRLNEATRGFYSGRLQAVTLLTIVVLLGLAVWFAQKFAF